MRAQGAGLDIADRRRQHAEGHRHVAADEIVHQRRRAFVGNDLHIEAGDRLEQFRAHVAAGAERRGADVELAALRLGQRDHVGNRLGRKRRMRDQRDRHRCDQPDAGEILARIVAGIGIERGIDRNRAGMAEQQACNRQAPPSPPRGCRCCRRRRRDCRPRPAGRAPSRVFRRRCAPWRRRRRPADRARSA